MKMNTIARLHAIEERVSKKTGELYKVGLFLEGVTCTNLMLPKEVPSNISLGDYKLTLSYNEKYRNLNLISMEQVSK